jgi:predicted GIY-YIG superfamily endonuclease
MFYCYILENDSNERTYNGFTTNPKRRIRQHNQIIKGGAKYTKLGTNWKYICLISGYPNKIEALKHEWKIKHPDNKKIRPVKYRTGKGRIIGLNEVLKNNPLEYKLNIKILNKYSNIIENNNDLYEINLVDEITFT